MAIFGEGEDVLVCEEEEEERWEEESAGEREEEAFFGREEEGAGGVSCKKGSPDTRVQEVMGSLADGSSPEREMAIDGGPMLDVAEEEEEVMDAGEAAEEEAETSGSNHA
jgi:hypothetical protein